MNMLVFKYVYYGLLEAFKDIYVGEKVEKWVKDIEKLAEMA